MRLFWKMFFATMFVSVTCLTFGGYILINSNFNTLLDNEAQIAYDYGDIAYYSLVNEINSSVNDNEENPLKILTKIAPSININNMNQKISFGIMNEKGEEIYSSLSKALDKDIIDSLEGSKKGWALKRIDDNVYMQSVRPVLLYENIFYIEIIRDVTNIFDSQKLQYQTLFKIIAGMFLFAGAVTFIISRFLMRRIVSLSKITNDIAMGHLSKRALENGNDEITLLSQNFNHMADDLEEIINKLQEEVNKKELFVGAFSHELKTPLTAIIGYSDMIRRKEMDKNQLHTCAEYIFSESKRLETLSMRLMDLIVLKNQELNFASVDIKCFLEEILSILSPQLKELNIYISHNIKSALIAMEPALMETVFINLIDNARKAIDTNGQIHIRGEQKDDRYILSIEDNGRGMEQEELSKIKDAFYMVDKSRSRKQGGTGLGLAICDEILRLHGFNIEFESHINSGTTVVIEMKGEQND